MGMLNKYFKSLTNLSGLYRAADTRKETTDMSSIVDVHQNVSPDDLPMTRDAAAKWMVENTPKRLRAFGEGQTKRYFYKDGAFNRVVEVGEGHVRECATLPETIYYIDRTRYVTKDSIEYHVLKSYQSIGYMYITRDVYGNIVMHSSQPSMTMDGMSSKQSLMLNNFSHLFTFITKRVNEAYNIKDLLYCADNYQD